ncbi:hypothetical protein N500_0168 [Wolbachia pipientis wUni]|nr:hypothetical protein N500_0168 [Wolbachia pipientis wUni]
MALRSKLLDEKVVESAKEMLKKVRNNAYVSKKLKCCNCSKKVQYNGCSKNILHFKKRTNFVGKTLENWQRRKTVCSFTTS